MHYIYIGDEPIGEGDFGVIDDFDYRITLPDNSELNSEGGIGITDVLGFNEIYIESAGLNQHQLMNFR